MMSISLEDVAGALAHCDPEQHADALARAGAESIARATNALDAATRLVATFPRDEVVAEADALLYDVLRWPLSDGVPRWEPMVTPESFTARQGISVGDAQLTVERLHATEADTARALLATGPIANYTLEQSQRGGQQLRDQVQVVHRRCAAFRNGPDPLQRAITSLLEPSPHVQKGVVLELLSCRLQAIDNRSVGDRIRAESDDVQEVRSFLGGPPLHGGLELHGDEGGRLGDEDVNGRRGIRHEGH